MQSINQKVKTEGRRVYEKGTMENRTEKHCLRHETLKKETRK